MHKEESTIFLSYLPALSGRRPLPSSPPGFPFPPFLFLPGEIPAQLSSPKGTTAHAQEAKAREAAMTAGTQLLSPGEKAARGTHLGVRVGARGDLRVVWAASRRLRAPPATSDPVSGSLGVRYAS